MQSVVGSDVFFLVMGAVLVLAMHAGFAFLEAGTVRKKNQVNALMKILTDFSVSTVAYFFVGYAVAYGINFVRRTGAILHRDASFKARNRYNIVALSEQPRERNLRK